jgi:transcriptional regulator of aromatic amino acid metabolism
MTQWAAAAKKQAKKSAARIFAVSAAGLPLPKAESDLFSQVEEGAKKVSLNRRRK